MAKILFFAQAREAAGCSELEWSITDPQSADTLWAWLILLHPRLALLRIHSRIARNGEYLSPGQPLLPRDEIAIIPPVSGG